MSNYKLDKYGADGVDWFEFAAPVYRFLVQGE